MRKGLQIFSIATPLALLIGCAHHSESRARFDDSAVGGSELSATSTRPDTRVYSNASIPASQAFPAPEGADAQNWGLAEAVRGRLMENDARARYPSKVVVTVPKGSDGMVRLSGYVPSNRERQKLYDVVAGVPGVKQVDNQLRIGDPKNPHEADARTVPSF